MAGVAHVLVQANLKAVHFRWGRALKLPLLIELIDKFGCSITIIIVTELPWLWQDGIWPLVRPGQQLEATVALQDSRHTTLCWRDSRTPALCHSVGGAEKDG